MRVGEYIIREIYDLDEDGNEIRSTRRYVVYDLKNNFVAEFATLEMAKEEAGRMTRANIARRVEGLRGALGIEGGSGQEPP